MPSFWLTLMLSFTLSPGLYSFLSVDRRKTYCLYEAPSVEAIRRAATRAGIPADVVIEVTGKVHSDGSLNPV